MFVRGIFPGILVIVFTFPLVKCSAQEEDDIVYTTDYKNETSLRCYDCSSQYDPRCGDPFNPFSIATVTCSEMKPPEQLINHDIQNLTRRLRPTVCRKIVQKVENNTRVIRECGYIRDDRDDKQCVVRTGTKNVHVTYCACTHSLCNAGINIRPSPFRVDVFLLLLIHLFFRC